MLTTVPVHVHVRAHHEFLIFFVSIYGPQAGPMLIATHVVPKIGGIFPFSLGLPSPLRPRATACTDDGFPAPHRPDPLSRLPLRSYESTLPFSLDICLWDLSSFVSAWPPKRTSTMRRAAVEEDRDVLVSSWSCCVVSVSRYASRPKHNP